MITVDEAMLKRIVQCFISTWSVTCADLHECFREQARAGDREARKACRDGLTQEQWYENLVDYVHAYGDDEEALDVWDRWHETDHQGSRAAIVAKLDGLSWE